MGTKAEEKKTTELKDSEPKQIGHGTFIVDVKYRENATWQARSSGPRRTRSSISVQRSSFSR